MVQALQIYATMLYHYYLSYKRKPHIIDKTICERLYHELVEAMCIKFDLANPQYEIDQFSLFPDDFTMDLQHLHDYDFDTLWLAFTEFPRTYHHIIQNSDVVLSIVPIPIDSLDITHGMLINFFTPIYE